MCDGIPSVDVELLNLVFDASIMCSGTLTLDL